MRLPFVRAMGKRPDGSLYMKSHRDTFRELGLLGWLAYQVGYARFLWRASRTRIVFPEEELRDLAIRLGTRP